MLTYSFVSYSSIDSIDVRNKGRDTVAIAYIKPGKISDNAGWSILCRYSNFCLILVFFFSKSESSLHYAISSLSKCKVWKCLIVKWPSYRKLSMHCHYNTTYHHVILVISSCICVYGTVLFSVWLQSHSCLVLRMMRSEPSCVIISRR